MKPLVNALENFQTLFPGNKPKGAISRLVELLGLLLRLEPDFDHILIPLKSFIQVIFGWFSSFASIDKAKHARS